MDPSAQYTIVAAVGRMSKYQTKMFQLFGDRTNRQIHVELAR